MNRLHRELLRLYVPQAPGAVETEPDEASLIDPEGRVRALVLALARPADWRALARVWQGVQADLALPAPAIAVSGDDSCQLWFSLATPVPAAQALGFVEALRRRYLADIPAHRVVLMPALVAGPPPRVRHARLVPARQAGSGHWSAFVAQDLAPAFADEPWLDLPPNPEGQANLLARLTSLSMADLEQAQQRLIAAEVPVQPPPADRPAASAAASAAAAGGLVSGGPTATDAGQQARRFLLDVMHNDAVALGLRIDAAKALLPGRG